MIGARIDEELCCQLGIEVFEFALDSNSELLSGKERKELEQVIRILSNSKLSAQERFNIATSTEIKDIFQRAPTRRYISQSASYQIYVERELALYGSWYEFFPRSEGAIKNKDGSITSGNFKTAIKSLDRVAKMNFDVLYLPPIHPLSLIHI